MRCTGASGCAGAVGRVAVEVVWAVCEATGATGVAGARLLVDGAVNGRVMAEGVAVMWWCARCTGTVRVVEAAAGVAAGRV
jgi:hypothetical protein